jgi:RNA polymerase sigma-70 factor (ECF subfamily)
MTVIHGIEEETLIQRFVNGDQTAFELLFRFYYPGLVTFVAQIIVDRDEAEEIVQDFFVNLWTGRKNIQKSTSLKSYFFVSVKNKAFNYLKREQIREKTFAQLKELVEKDFLYQPDLFVESELQQQIAKAMEKLPVRTLEVFMMSRFKGLSNDEIAFQLELSKRTIETQISNALKILRNELKEYKFLLLLF